MADEVRVRIVNAEALMVGADEVLVLRFPEGEDDSPEMIEFMQETFDSLGIGNRVAVFFGDVEMTKVAR